MADLRTFVLAARKSLIRETEEQLVQLYGLNASGTFLPQDQILGLSRGKESAEAIDTYKKLKRLLEDEREAGIAAGVAIKKLCKEVAFTHLNRLVALKLLEGQKLIRGAINNWHNSNAFLFYLAEHEDDRQLFQLGSQPEDDRSEGPNDRAYRHFLLWQFGLLAAEVKVLFDPDDLPSRLFPRPLVLRSLTNDLNGDDLKEYWTPGNEETLGWVYQFFNAQEKAEAFDRVFKKKQKFQKEDIPAATQIFTPRWIVEYLVQNSLGRLWVSLHPDSGLARDMPYLVPLAGEPPTAVLKAAKDIRLLDPATGTMHFGLVAFDWLVKMYREEMDRAGQPGWPSKPSVDSEDSIPGSILANNLFGIDIDLRAVQLSALSLYLRAKRTNKAAKVTETQLACADVAIFRGQHLERIAGELQLPNAATRQLFSRFCESVAEAAQMGSLVRLENHFQNLEARRLRQVVNDYVARKAAEGEDESYFGNETSKGLRLLDVMTRRYDVVFTNPPYMSTGNMSPTMSKFMKDNYKKSKGDLYSAFIERCFELLAEGGRLAMLTQQSFMFISSFEKLREILLQNTAIENMVHLGPRAFAEVTGEKVNTTAYVLRREAIGNIAQRGDAGVYFRLVREPDAAAKRVAFEEALANRKMGEPDRRVFEYLQGDFQAIPGLPWVYQMTPSLRIRFIRLDLLISKASAKQGLATADNPRFIRFWWEVGIQRIGRHYESRISFNDAGMTWCPHMKGGGDRRWVANKDSVINWKRDGAELFALQPKSVIRNADYYFRPGITYNAVSGKSFKGMPMPAGCIFDSAGDCVFPNAPEDILCTLGLLNSQFAKGILTMLNPTLNVYTSDLDRLPVPRQMGLSLSDLAKLACDLAAQSDHEDETVFDFKAPPAWPDGGAAVALRVQKLAEVERNIEEEVYSLYEVTASDRAAIEAELSLPTDNSDSVTTSDSDEEPSIAEPTDSDALTERDLSIQWTHYATGVALGRFQPGEVGGLGMGAFSAEVAARMRELSCTEGFMVVEEGHPDDLAQRVLDILRIAQGDREAESIVRLATRESATTLRESVEKYLLGTFFKDHVKRYRKRPIFWLLQSPNRTYSAYLFHERATANTLSTLQGNRYLGGRIHQMEMELTDLLNRTAKAGGVEKTGLAKRAREIAEIVEDLKAFDAKLGAASQVPITGADGSPKTVRWEPELDDGVLLNAAPLRELMPAWKKADAKLDLMKAWKELESGEYDWAKTAMRYWPRRVLKACKNDKSYAIAHGLR